MLWDTHMHSICSGDSQAPMEDMAEAAVRKNLDGICFTDHLDIDYPGNPGLFLLDLTAYAASVGRIRQLFHGRMDICFGLELGLMPHLALRHKTILSQYPFDFIIGSSHVVHGRDPYYPAFYEGRREDDCYLEYFESILENIRAFDGFDVYGHIDYVVRYGPDRNTYYSYAKYRDVIDEILALLIEKGKGIEINTGGFKYGLGHPNPTEEIIARYRSLGGEIITIGSDAHEPGHVAFDFQKVPDILRADGFSYYTVFRERKPVFIKL